MDKFKTRNLETVEDFWLKLDNAAKIFPAILDKQLTVVFRISVLLKERVKIKQFFETVKEIDNRFPYYKVQLRKGFFWYYLEYNNSPINVEVDDETQICRGFDSGLDTSMLFRLLVKNNSISVEFSHILTDGAGALEFLKTLLYTYFSKCGIPIPSEIQYLKPNQIISEEEFDDSYSRFYKKNFPYSVKLPRAFHLPFKLTKYSKIKVTKAILPLDQVLSNAKSFNVSITVYLTAIYLSVLQQIFNDLSPWKRKYSDKILRVQVPVNLRKIFSSVTMRNFSLFVLPEIDLRIGHYTFDEIIKKVYHAIELETDEKLISKTISRNVGSEKNIIIRSTPLFIKSLILNFKYYSLGSNQYSGVFSNLGRMELNDSISHLIDYFLIIPPPPNKLVKMGCGVIGFENKLALSFVNITGSNQFEEKFLNFLVKSGIESTELTYNE